MGKQWGQLDLSPTYHLHLILMKKVAVDGNIIARQRIGFICIFFFLTDRIRLIEAFDEVFLFVLFQRRRRREIAAICSSQNKKMYYGCRAGTAVG